MRPTPLHGTVWGAMRVQFEVQAGQTSAGALVAAAARQPTVCACAGGDVTDVGKKQTAKKKPSATTAENPSSRRRGGVGVETATTVGRSPIGRSLGDRRSGESRRGVAGVARARCRGWTSTNARAHLVNRRTAPPASDAVLPKTHARTRRHVLLDICSAAGPTSFRPHHRRIRIYVFGGCVR